MPCADRYNLNIERCSHRELRDRTSAPVVVAAAARRSPCDGPEAAHGPVVVLVVVPVAGNRILAAAVSAGIHMEVVESEVGEEEDLGRGSLVVEADAVEGIQVAVDRTAAEAGSCCIHLAVAADILVEEGNPGVAEVRRSQLPHHTEAVLHSKTW